MVDGTSKKQTSRNFEMMSGKIKVLLAMSGGVDSSVAAKLLLNQGYEVIGVTLKVWSYKETYFGKSGSKSDSDYIIKAQKLAESLNMEHHVVDIQKEFYANIIKPFIEAYFNAQTPNPCVWCNPTMKFGTFLNLANHFQCDLIATGHYVQKSFENNRFFLRQGVDSVKDQSYVLWKLNQEILEKALFPLGIFHKEEIKELATQYGFVEIARQKESYDICFIPNSDYRTFLKLHEPEKCETLRDGVIIDQNEKWLGKHKGYPFYTIGQRKGLEVAVGHPVYVTKLDPDKNRVILGEKEELLSNILHLTDVTIQKYSELPENYNTLVRIRYKDYGQFAKITKMNDYYECVFEQPVSAATPGQSAVFYEGDQLIGGGIIVNAFLKP